MQLIIFEIISENVSFKQDSFSGKSYLIMKWLIFKNLNLFYLKTNEFFSLLFKVNRKFYFFRKKLL